ncbi:MAG: hypothetical protein PHE56_05100 [Bacteroidales bacterium]|nr:hypothetical protein [Bacteroidales bacterium]
MSKVNNINTYNPVSDENLLFDNNVWLYLFHPMQNSNKLKQRQYSVFLKKVQTVRATIWINALVVSEFCNAWLKIEFKNWKKKPENIAKTDYKRDFVKSEQYYETVKEIKEILPQILKITTRGSDDFHKINIEHVLNLLESSDFNDSYYLALSKMNNWTIVTDDADFFDNPAVNIVTANIK